jgi:hypothetical protein
MFAFDFKLKDQSLFLFVSDGSDIHQGTLSYSYLESPVDVMFYDEFVAWEFQLAPNDPEVRQLIQSGDSSFAADYEQLLFDSACDT